MKDNMGSDDNRKLLSALSHASILLGFTVLAVAIPIVILLTTQDLVVKENAKEALNFFINSYVLAVICIPLTFVIIGLPLFVLLLIATWVMPIIAIVKVIGNPDRSYRYPIIIHLL